MRGVGKSFKRGLPPHQRVSTPVAGPIGRTVPYSNRARTVQRNQRVPFAPPENWYEPAEDGAPYRFVIQDPGPGYRHVVTPAEVRHRLAQLPAEFLKPLEVIQFSQITRKKQSFPCYGMQWGAALYLYPIEEGLVERYPRPPKPAQ